MAKIIVFSFQPAAPGRARHSALRRRPKTLFVLIIDRAVRGQLALDGVDPLDEPLDFACRTARFVRLRLGRDVLEFVGIRMRKIERELCARGADELIQDARRKYYRFKRTAGRAAERSRAHRGETYRNARLRDKREAEVVADKVVFLCYETAEERAGVFADDSREEVAHTDNYQRHVADG